MAQIPGSVFVTETGSTSKQIPGGVFITETVSAGLTVNSDHEVGLEYRQSTNADKAVPVDNSLTVNSDHEVGLEYRQSTNADKTVPVDNSLTVKVDAVSSMDNTAGINALSDLPIEWIGSLTVNSDHEVGLEYRQSTNADKTVPVDNSLTVRVDTLVTFESELQVAADGLINVDFDAAAAAGGSVTVDPMYSGHAYSEAAYGESIAGGVTVNSDHGISIDWIAALNINASVPLAMDMTVSVDAQAAFDHYLKVIIDKAIELSILASVNGTLQVPVEWGGVPIVDSIHEIGFDFSTAVNADGATALAINEVINADVFVSLQILAGIQADSAMMFDILSNIVASAIIPAEWKQEGAAVFQTGNNTIFKIDERSVVWKTNAHSYFIEE